MRIKFVIPVVTILFLSSCFTTRLNVLEIDNPEPYTSLNDILENQNSARFLIVHGMTTHEEGYQDEIIENILKQLEWPESQKEKINIPVFLNECESLLTIEDYQYKGKTIRFYTVLWSPITEKEKNELKKIDKSNNRLPLTSELKEFILDDGFSEAILYNGGYKEAIQNHIGYAMFYALSGTKPDPGTTADPSAQWEGTTDSLDNHLFIISASLGSKIVFDTVNRYSTAKDQAATRFMESYTKNKLTLFQFANQIPLLSLDSHTPDNNKMSLNESNYGSMQRVLSIGERRIELIAFNDPNDFFSYPVPREMNSSGPVINVEISVAKTGYKLPFQKPRIANPMDAHLNYSKNQDVINFIVNGFY